jgi:hypothetical protein
MSITRQHLIRVPELSEIILFTYFLIS